MATGNEMLRRLKEVKNNLPEYLSEIAKQQKEQLADLNRFQLSEGKNNEGGYLPRYIDDPYFNSIEGAIGYQIWKRKVSPNPDKPEDVMDLFIRGDLHESIKADVSGNELKLWTNSPIGDDVFQKTKGKFLGLNPESVKDAWEAFFRPKLKKRISRATGIK